MMRTRVSFAIYSIVFLLAAVGIAASASAITYTATLLSPPGYSVSSGQGAAGAIQVGNATVSGVGNKSHAVIWNGTAGSLVDLHPAGMDYSWGWGAQGSTQVGSASGPSTGFGHAMMWTGTAASAVDLHPADFTNSQAEDADGTMQIGYGKATLFGNNNHALLWNGTATSAVDLHPAGYTYSYAYGISGASQVGMAGQHAILWNSTAASAVDLNPPGYTFSEARGILGSQQVGSGGSSTSTAGRHHALLWNGAAASAVDLNPVGVLESHALDLNDTNQVGWGVVPGTLHALLWRGSAASALDLHPFLAGLAPNFSSSQANAISETGIIVGRASDTNKQTYAVMWTPVVESGIPGDYNNNGAVDAADYTLWRKGTNALANEVVTLGVNTAEDYTAWRARLGNTAGSGSAIIDEASAVPEPNSCAILICTLALAASLRRRRVNRQLRLS